MTRAEQAILRVLRDAHPAAVDGLYIAQQAPLNSGRLYNALDRLTRAGLIESEWEGRSQAGTLGPRRRLYRLAEPPS